MNSLLDFYRNVLAVLHRLSEAFEYFTFYIDGAANCVDRIDQVASVILFLYLLRGFPS